MRLERVLCVGGKSHAQLVTLEGVHMMKKNYDVLEIIFANKLGELNGKA